MKTRDFRLPDHYSGTRARFPLMSKALEELGTAVRKEGPLDPKIGHLIQLAASAAIRSEGSVHSHTKRALEGGATPEEIRHTLLLLTSTIGFPTVSAALSWAEDVLKQRAGSIRTRQERRFSAKGRAS